VESVRSTLERAEVAEANRYAPEPYQRAHGLLKLAIGEVEAQNARFAWSRSYDHAQQLLSSAEEAALAAHKAADAARAEERQGATRLIDEVQARLDALRAVIQKRHQGNWSTTVEFLAWELALLYLALEEARWAFRNGDYLTARLKADSIGTDAAKLQHSFSRLPIPLAGHSPSSRQRLPPGQLIRTADVS
jgi:hypothetical protein